MTVNSGYKRRLGCVLEKKGFRIICLFVLSVCFVFSYRRRKRKRADGRRWKAKHLSSASWFSCESFDVKEYKKKLLHLQVTQNVLGSDLQVREEWNLAHILVVAVTTFEFLSTRPLEPQSTLPKAKSSWKVPFSNKSSLLPLSLTRTPHQSLIMCSVGLSCVTRLMRHHSRDWCMKCSLRM